MTPDDIKDVPDGALVDMTIRGRLIRDNENTFRIVQADDSYRWYELSDGPSGGHIRSLLRMATSIEVLPEPVVEPTGLGAVVEALYRDSLRDRRPVTAVRSSAGKLPWALTDSGVLVTWDQLIEPVVRSEGWKGVDAPDDYVDKRADENRADCTNCGMSDAACTKKVLRKRSAGPCCSECRELDTHPIMPKEGGR